MYRQNSNVIKYIHNHFFGTLRKKLICLAIFMVFLPTLLMAFSVEKQGRRSMLEEKTSKLYSVTHLLDQALDDGFDRYPALPRQERIQALNRYLAGVTEKITAAFPNVAAGYYNKELDAIITYAPQKYYSDKVGVSIEGNHPGRIVMENGKPLIRSGRQVRGDIMNAMIPIYRHQKIVGYIWANELIHHIDKQELAMDLSILAVTGIGLLLSVFLIIVLSRKITQDVDIIKAGLYKLPIDLRTAIPPMHGEMGEISDSINAISHALLEAKTLNELIIESAADAIISVDNQCRIRIFNPAAQVITGYSLEEVLGKPYRDIFNKTNFQSPILDTLNYGVTHVGIEVEYPAKNRRLYIKASSSQLYNSDGQIIGALVIFTDLTAQKQMQDQIGRAERLAALGELVAGIAHEVRNPLTSISGFIQYLNEGETEPQRNDYFRIIRKEIGSLNKLIQQLLEFSRPHPQHYQWVSLNQLIKESLLLVKSYGFDKKVDFNLSLDESLPKVEVDPPLIKQVILNLIINAMQAIVKTGMVAIHTEPCPVKCVQISIEDSGIGIMPEAIEKVFTPFFTTKPTGTGLGLSIAQRIMTAHNGSITLHSRPGRGTTVIIILPISNKDRNPS
ncbi:two-component system sensor histidine kinase AtoS [Sodalis ligni]|uniref:histidine kinase n=1 Tax=Sodalis ligni TaxID=2697027 RepID=A0A4R1N978_9GAMM|nr:two-component system sensor histidine kinase AtoS [Sodalis ligni]TCL03227.1 PAS/PAC sensor signal transduction histidine kinase [Sodalis ligni]